jgi:hypothetical protein
MDLMLFYLYSLHQVFYYVGFGPCSLVFCFPGPAAPIGCMNEESSISCHTVGWYISAALMAVLILQSSQKPPAIYLCFRDAM